MLSKISKLYLYVNKKTTFYKMLFLLLFVMQFAYSILPVDFELETFLVEKSPTEESSGDCSSEDLEDENNKDFFKLYNENTSNAKFDVCGYENESFAFLRNQKLQPVFLESPYSPPETI